MRPCRTWEALIKPCFAASVGSTGIEETIRRLKALKESRAYTFGDAGVQNKLGNVMDLFRGLSNGIAPTMAHVATDDFGKFVWTQLPAFCAEPKSSDSDEVVTGKAAFELKLQRAEKLRDDKLLTFEALSPLHTYDFLADPAEKNRLQKLTDTLMSGLSAGVKKRKASVSAKEAKKSKSSVADEYAEVDAIFE